MKLSWPNAICNETGPAAAGTATSARELRGRSRVATIRSAGMLSTTAPATARLVSSSACDNSGSENLSSARAGSNTTPPVNARPRTTLPGGPCSPSPQALLGRRGGSKHRGDRWAAVRTSTGTRPTGSPVPAVGKDGRHGRRQAGERIQGVPQEVETGATLHEYLVTGRNGQPFVFQVPAAQVDHHRAIPADHLYLVQPAQFRRPARLRDRLREGRPLGQPIKVRLTYLSRDGHREHRLQNERHALLICGQHGAQSFPHHRQGCPRDFHDLVYRVHQGAVRGDDEVAAQLSVAPHVAPEDIAWAEGPILQRSSQPLGRYGAERHQQQHRNEPSSPAPHPVFLAVHGDGEVQGTC